MEIVIDGWYPASGAIPSSGSDSLGAYDSWTLNDEATFTFQVPDDYIEGTDLSLELHEATDGESKKHNWQITAVLNGSSGDVFTEEFTSPASADTLATRTIDFSADGQIDSTDIAVDDTVTITLKRIAASGTEDSNDIRTYTATIVGTFSEESESGCLGDVGAIIDEVLDLTNDAEAEHISVAQIIRAMNAGLRYITKKHYFKKESDLNITGGTGSIVISSQVSDFRKAFSLRYENGDTTELLEQCPSWEQFQQRVRDNADTGDPEYWIAVSNTIHFTPVPTASETGTLKLLHSYSPTPLACSSNYTVPFPGADYDVLVFWCVWWIHGRFYSDNRMNEMAHWWKMFGDALSDLIEQGYGELAFRPS